MWTFPQQDKRETEPVAQGVEHGERGHATVSEPNKSTVREKKIQEAAREIQTLDV